MAGFVESLYAPPKDSRKGDNGRLLVIGGGRQYHGAPVFALLAARRFVDLLYFLPGEKDAHLIGAVKAIPEAIVVDSARSPAIRGKLDCVLYGIGLGDARPELPKTIKPGTGGPQLVIDGDGLRLMKGRIPKGAILTPHENEFRMLFKAEGSERNVLAMARLHKCVILKKGPIDVIADGRPGAGCGRVGRNRTHNQGMTKGGTGDVLAGIVAALACKNDAFTAAVAGAQINGTAGNVLKKRLGYNYCAGDLAETAAAACMELRGRRM
jgi:hydroxyethylthiazole kinase-like uncharacterized protein yjeF